MATSVEQAVREREAKALTRQAAFVRAPSPYPSPANENPRPVAESGPRPGTDPMDFIRDNRIHLKDGSVFVDAYLVIHPRELDPANEPQLRKKLKLTYSINNPSFYEDGKRYAIAEALAQLVPVSTEARVAAHNQDTRDLNEQITSGIDKALQRRLADQRTPMAAIVRDATQEAGDNPIGLEMAKNGLGLYLLLREKLTQEHFVDPVTKYVMRTQTPDQLLHDVSGKLGVTPQQFAQAAQQGGIEGVGQLLGLDPRYVADVRRVCEQSAQQGFGYNMIEHWHLGRQLLGLDAPIEQKIAAGMDARITAKIHQYRADRRGYYDVPEPIRKQAEHIARTDLSVLEPIQRQLMHALGYEICHTPENTADKIAFHEGVYGLHRKAANDLSDFHGTYRIYYGGHGSHKAAVGTLAHEVAHNFWPSYFNAQGIAEIDRLANNDAQRFEQLNRLMDERFDQFSQLLARYHAADARGKSEVIAEANKEFAPYGLTVDGLFPHLREPHSFRYLVWDANDVLKVSGERYQRSGYNSPQERFREVISRYAEKRQVSHRHEPEVLRFVAPGLTQVWEHHYIPHLEQVYQDVMRHQSPAPVAAELPDVAPPPRPATENPPPAEPQPKMAEHPQQGAAMAAERSDSQPTSRILAKTAQLGNVVALNDQLQRMGIAVH